MAGATTCDPNRVVMRAALPPRYLASRGADVDAESRRGRTPLHYAAASGAEEVITFLLARDAWMEASDDADDTAFSLAW